MVSLLCMTAAAVAGPGCSGSSSPDHARIARYLTGLVRHPEAAARIGGVYVKSDATTQLLSYRELTELILRESGLGTVDKLAVGLDEIGERVKERVHQDFLDERVVEIDGWLLSRTEVMLCTLVHLQQTGAS